MKPDCPADVWVYLACVMFFLGLYKDAEEAASKGTDTRRVNTLLHTVACGIAKMEKKSLAI